MKIKIINFCFLLFITSIQAQHGTLLDDISPSNKAFVKTSCKECSSKLLNTELAIEQAERLNRAYYANYAAANFSTASKKTIGTVSNPMRHVHILADKIPVFGSLLQGLIDPILDQALEKQERDELNENRKALNNGLEGVFSTYIQSLELSGATQTDIGQGINAYLESNNINPDEYSVYGKQIDEFVLEYIVSNENKIAVIEQQAKDEIRQLLNNQEVSTVELERNLNERLVKNFNLFSNSLIQVNDLALKGLEKYKELSTSLQLFESKVYDKFEIMASDIEEMQSEIDGNSLKIEENKRFIENNKNQIKEVNLRLQENRDLTTQNAYKIDVMLGVQYDNSNISGKLKLLEVIKFSDDPVTNKSFIEKEKNRLGNIQTVKDIEYKLQIGTELVTLAGNLGLPEKDLENVNKAIQIGNVIAQGAMAYFTGNPLQGLQALNGAFAIFGGGNEASDPRFEQILQELKQISGQIRIIDKKIDELDRKIVKLYELNVKLHQETISRFNQIDYKLDNLNDQIGYVIKILTSDCAALSFSVEDNETLLRNVDRAESLDMLNIQHITYPILSDLLNCLNDNVKVRDISARSFIHFNRIDKNNTWESRIFKPMLDLVTVYSNTPEKKEVFNRALKNSNLYTNEFSSLLRDSRNLNSQNKYLVNTSLSDLDILLHPESIIQLSSMLNRFEPYFYFGNVNKSYEIYPMDKLQTYGENGFFEGRSETLRGWYKTLLRDTEISIAQQNLLAGSPILPLIYSELSDYSTITNRTKKIFRLLASENYYLKTNYATYAIFNEIGTNIKMLKLLGDSFYREKALVDKNVAIINQSFNGDIYNLVAIENNGLYVPMLSIKTPPGDSSAEFEHQIILPIQTMDVIIENKMIYPKVVDDLIFTHEFISSKVVEHDMMVNAEKEDFQEFKKLLNLN